MGGILTVETGMINNIPDDGRFTNSINKTFHALVMNR